jgi:hypothetical protein
MLLHQDSPFVPFAQDAVAPRVHGNKDDYGRALGWSNGGLM